MEIAGIDSILEQHPVFAGLAKEHIDRIAGCASNLRYMPGEYLARAGAKADHFYLIRFGSVALEAYVPGRGALTIQTRSEGELAGWGSMFPPYEWHFDVRALSLVRVVVFDAQCVRAKSEEDPRFGYEVLKRFAGLIIDRLENTRMQLLDLYATQAQPR